MIKIYEQFPEIVSLKSRVISKNYDKNKTYLNLDRTIFMPYNDVLLNDKGFIDGKKVLGVEEKNGKIIHIVEGKISRREVVLSLDREVRYKNLKLATGFSLFKIFFDTYNLPHKMDFAIENGKGAIFIEDFRQGLDRDLIEGQINYAIDAGLKIEKSKGIVELPGIGKTINNLICFDRTYKLKSFKILDTERTDSNMKVIFDCDN